MDVEKACKMVGVLIVNFCSVLSKKIVTLESTTQSALFRVGESEALKMAYEREARLV